MFGSFGDSRTEMPPSVIEFRTWNRVSGTVGELDVLDVDAARGSARR